MNAAKKYKPSDITYPLDFDSEFGEKMYLLKDGHLVIRAEDCGRLCVKLENLKPFAQELLEISEVYEGVRV